MAAGSESADTPAAESGTSGHVPKVVVLDAGSPCPPVKLARGNRALAHNLAKHINRRSMAMALHPLQEPYNQGR
jgi:hypothetical protein